MKTITNSSILIFGETRDLKKKKKINERLIENFGIKQFVNVLKKKKNC